MLTLDATTQAFLAGSVTRPHYLIEIEFSTVWRHSTHEDFLFGADQYYTSGTKVESIEPSNARLSFDNSDLSASAAFLGQDVRDIPIKIYALYTHPSEFLPDTASTPVLVFDGVLDAIEAVNQVEVVVTCLSSRLAAAWTPRIVAAPPLCNHMPPAGTQLGNLTLEPARNG